MGDWVRDRIRPVTVARFVGRTLSLLSNGACGADELGGRRYEALYMIYGVHFSIGPTNPNPRRKVPRVSCCGS